MNKKDIFAVFVLTILCFYGLILSTTAANSAEQPELPKTDEQVVADLLAPTWWWAFQTPTDVLHEVDVRMQESPERALSLLEKTLVLFAQRYSPAQYADERIMAMVSAADLPSRLNDTIVFAMIACMDTRSPEKDLSPAELYLHNFLLKEATENHLNLTLKAAAAVLNYNIKTMPYRGTSYVSFPNKSLQDIAKRLRNSSNTELLLETVNLTYAVTSPSMYIKGGRTDSQRFQNVRRQMISNKIIAMQKPLLNTLAAIDLKKATALAIIAVRETEIDSYKEYRRVQPSIELVRTFATEDNRKELERKLEHLDRVLEWQGLRLEDLEQAY